MERWHCSYLRRHLLARLMRDSLGGPQGADWLGKPPLHWDRGRPARNEREART
jgi:hypothetical protein